MSKGRGLNRGQRLIIIQQARNGADGSYLRNQIDMMADYNDWDYDENMCLVAELSRLGRVETAKYLERLNNGR